MLTTDNWSRPAGKKVNQPCILSGSYSRRVDRKCRREGNKDGEDDERVHGGLRL